MDRKITLTVINKSVNFMCMYWR